MTFILLHMEASKKYVWAVHLIFHELFHLIYDNKGLYLFYVYMNIHLYFLIFPNAFWDNMKTMGAFLGEVDKVTLPLPHWIFFCLHGF